MLRSMPETYRYTARSLQGEKKSGLLEAESPDRVAAILSDQKMIPIEIKAARDLTRRGVMGLLKGRQYSELILFTRNLSTLYKAGIPLLRALAITNVGPESSYFNAALIRIRGALQAGVPMSQAMASMPDIFPRIYTSAIAAGETSGRLDLVLDSLSDMLEREMELTRQLKSALRYPIIVVTAIAAAFAILITFVVPRFVAFYGKMGTELPLPTQGLIFLNHIITAYWYYALGLAIISILIIRKILATEKGRLYFDTQFLRVPIFGALIIKGNTARFCYILNILISSGIPLVTSLEILSGVVKNTKLAREVDLMAENFRQGRGLEGFMAQKVAFPNMALQMMSVGLESGSLDDMLQQIAAHYTREVDYTSRQLVAILEPILTIILGIFILLVALAIFLPMWNLIQTFRG